jgi:cytokinin dehydrogenase
MREMRPAREAAVVAAREAGVSYYLDAATQAAAEMDFGGIARGRSLLTAEPATADASARLIGALGKQGLGCTLRGAGYGQSGQSVAHDTVSLSTRRLDWIHPVDVTRSSITVGAGASLKRVLLALESEKLLEEGPLAPPSLPLNLDMSIGGLLSAGGIGPASHRHGPVAANVRALQVVTGAGDVVSCTPDDNAELFDGVLAGLGQCGLITQATLALRPAPRRMRVFSFVYADARPWLEDQLAVSSGETAFELEGFCWAAARGMRSTPHGLVPFTHWTYGLHLATDASPANASACRDVIASLHATRLVDEHEADLLPYLGRYESRFSGMVQSGQWTDPHPWFEAMVPIERAADALAEVLSLLPVAVGDGHRFLLLDSRRLPRSFGVARAPRSALIGILPVSFPRSALPAVLRCVDQLTDVALKHGGRRYLSGWLASDAPAYFRAHYGDAYDTWLRARRRFDPSAVFRSALFPEGHGGD